MAWNFEASLHSSIPFPFANSFLVTIFALLPTSPSISLYRPPFRHSLSLSFPFLSFPVKRPVFISTATLAILLQPSSPSSVTSPRLLMTEEARKQGRDHGGPQRSLVRGPSFRLARCQPCLNFNVPRFIGLYPHVRPSLMWRSKARLVSRTFALFFGLSTEHTRK